MKEAFIYRIGYGDVFFWNDKWVLKGRLCHKVPFIDYQDVNMRVNDIF